MGLVQQQRPGGRHAPVECTPGFSGTVHQFEPPKSPEEIERLRAERISRRAAASSKKRRPHPSRSGPPTHTESGEGGGEVDELSEEGPGSDDGRGMVTDEAMEVQDDEIDDRADAGLGEASEAERARSAAEARVDHRNNCGSRSPWQGSDSPRSESEEATPSDEEFIASDDDSSSEHERKRKRLG